MNKRKHQRKRKELDQLMLKMLSLNLLEKLREEIGWMSKIEPPFRNHVLHTNSPRLKILSNLWGEHLYSIVPVAWVSGPPTQVQQMSPNSAALALLSGFTEGRIQMQGETVKHLSGVHMGETKQVTIELIQPNGKSTDKIEKKNFLDWSEQKELAGDEMLEAEIKKRIDSNLCSMGRQKKGRDPDKLSPAAKNRWAAEAKAVTEVRPRVRDAG